MVVSIFTYKFTRANKNQSVCIYSIRIERRETKKERQYSKRVFKLFLSKGYNTVSFTDVERVAKVTRGAIFHHFSNKEDLFKHVADQFIFIFLEDVEVLK